MERKVLGRGLDALIPKKTQVVDAEGFMILPLAKLRPGKYQPRQEFDEKELKELSQSIKEQGFIQPIVVRRDGGRYQMIVGERRLRATKMAGRTSIPAIVRVVRDDASLKYALIENLHRNSNSHLRVLLENSNSRRPLLELISRVVWDRHLKTLLVP